MINATRYKRSNSFGQETVFFKRFFRVQ